MTFRAPPCMCVAAVTYTQTVTYVLHSNVIIYIYIYIPYIYLPDDGLIEAEICDGFDNVIKNI